MIYFVRAKTLASGRVNFTIKIDAAAAKIKDNNKKQYVESEISIRINRLAYEIREGIGAVSEASLRRFIRDELFVHYVDMYIIENFITNIKEQSIKYADDIAETGLDVLYEYENE